MKTSARMLTPSTGKKKKPPKNQKHIARFALIANYLVQDLL